MKLKTVLFTTFYIYLSLPAFCQVVAVENDQQNVFYRGYPNPITIAVENSPSSSIEVTTDNGEISKNGNGRYTITPKRIGNVTISIYRQSTKERKLIDQKEFRVKWYPLTLSLGGSTGREIPALSAYLAIAPSASIYMTDVDTKALITKFTVLVKRNGQEVFHRQIQDPHGARVDSLTHHFFKTLENGDQLLFTNVICKEMDGFDHDLGQLEFTITHADDLKKALKSTDWPRMVIDPITNQEVYIDD